MRATRQPHSRGPRARLAIVIICALTLSACTLGPSQRPNLATFDQGVSHSQGTSPSVGGSSLNAPPSPSTVSPDRGQRSAPVTWQKCPDTISPTAPDGTTYDLRCASIRVPISYSQPERGPMSLAITRARAADTPNDADPLLVISGGPGERDTRDIAAVAAELDPTLLTRYSVIMVDLRGTGRSSGVNCVTPSVRRAILGMTADPRTAAGRSQLESISTQLTFDCGDTVGPAISWLNSANAAADLDTVRAALTAPTLSIVASGYGATLAATYADRYPSHIRRLVLDSPSDPAATATEQASRVAAAADALLSDFALACADFAGGCPLGNDPAHEVTTLVNDLAVSGYGAGALTVTGGTVVLALLLLLPDQSAWPALAKAIAALQQADAAPLAQLVRDALTNAADDATSGQANVISTRLTASVIFRCNDTAQRLTGQDLTDAANDAANDEPLFGPAIVSLAGLCGAWPSAEEPTTRVTADGAVPILVIGAVKAVRHPYRDAQALVRQLSSAVLISWQSASERSYPTSPCVSDIVDTYLQDGTVPTKGVLCAP